MSSFDFEGQQQLIQGQIRRQAREVAREEIASLCGLVLRRSQDAHFSRLEERNIADAAVREHLASVFAEALADFSGRTKGEQPGPKGGA